jgi:hypothetical protein
MNDSSRREFFQLFGFASFALILASCRDTVLAPPTETVPAGSQPAIAPTGTPVGGNYGNNNSQNQNNANNNNNNNLNNGQGNPPQNGGANPTATPTPSTNNNGGSTNPNNGNTPKNPTPTPTPTATPKPSVPGGATVTMQDIRMEGWSTLGSGFLGENGALSTNLIKANKTVTLNYTQDSHGHKFTLTPEHFLQLRQGKVVEVITTEAQGHKHMVRMNPARVVPSSAKVTMPINM